MSKYGYDKYIDESNGEFVYFGGSMFPPIRIGYIYVENIPNNENKNNIGSNELSISSIEVDDSIYDTDTENDLDESTFSDTDDDENNDNLFDEYMDTYGIQFIKEKSIKYETVKINKKKEKINYKISKKFIQINNGIKMYRIKYTIKSEVKIGTLLRYNINTKELFENWFTFENKYDINTPFKRQIYFVDKLKIYGKGISYDINIDQENNYGNIIIYADIKKYNIQKDSPFREKLSNIMPNLIRNRSNEVVNKICNILKLYHGQKKIILISPSLKNLFEYTITTNYYIFLDFSKSIEINYIITEYKNNKKKNILINILKLSDYLSLLLKLFNDNWHKVQDYIINCDIYKLTSGIDKNNVLILLNDFKEFINKNDEYKNSFKVVFNILEKYYKIKLN